MTYDELLRGLWALGHAQGMRLGLERVEAAAERLGRPNLDHPAVPVAGTDGKGSTAHVASRILQRHGLRVGLTTSPHLHRLTERIRIDGDGIPRDELAQLATEAEARLGSWADGSLTFFEVVTLLAFAAFLRRAVDVSVVEVGLGGRLDATRLCRPAVSVITSIGLDHTEWLGDTLGAIAGEKAGIFVPGVPVVLGPLAPEAIAVIAARAGELGCPAVRWDETGRGVRRRGRRRRRCAGLDLQDVNSFARPLADSPPLAVPPAGERRRGLAAAASPWRRSAGRRTAPLRRAAVRPARPSKQVEGRPPI